MAKKILVLCLFGIVACSGQVIEKNDVLSIAVPVEMLSIDPFRVLDTPSTQIRYQVFEQVVQFNKDGDIVPVLASSWTNINSTTLQIHLKTNVSFHNGDTLTSEDVVYSYNKAKTSPSTSTYFKAVKEVKAINSNTVQITTYKPYAPLLASLSSSAGFIVNKKSYENGDFSVGTGPFRLGEWTQGQNLILERNDYYWGQKAGVQTIQVKTIPEQLIRLISVETGEIDIAYDISYSERERILDNPELTFAETMINRIEYLGFSETKAPYNNVNLRKAIAYALDNKGIINSVLFGGGEESPANAPNLVRKDMFQEKIIQNLETAKDYLKASGLSEDTVLTLTVNDGVRKNIAEVIQASLKEIELEVKIEVVEWSRYADMVYDLQMGMFLGGWSTVPDLDLTYSVFFDSNSIGAGGNFTEYNNPKMDSLLQQARANANPNERYKIYTQVEDLAKETMTLIPLYTPIKAIVYRGVTNVNYDAFNENRWSLISKK